MRIFALLLFLVLLLLQFRLWLSDDGVRDIKRLDTALTAQRRENADLKARNEQLGAEVKDLKEGLDAVEERARSDLGMVGSNETFYQVIPPDASEGSGAASAPAEEADGKDAKPRRPPATGTP